MELLPGSHPFSKARQYAQDNLANTNLCDTTEFPQDVWEAMGKNGLMAFCAPEEFGGSSGRYQDLVEAACGLVYGGCCLGLAASWAIHCLVARFAFLDHGNTRQKKTILPQLAQGQATACLAISEPKTGAHPARMRTQAERQEEDFALVGEKAWCTNGPIADWYVVVAVTGEGNGKKSHTAFCVPRHTPGLSVEQMHLDFLLPSPHGAVVLDGCRVPASAFLGRMHTAYADLVRPFRPVEDVLMAALGVGGLARRVEVLAGLMATGSLPENARGRLGELWARTQSMASLASRAGAVLDEGQEVSAVLPFTITLRHLAGQTLAQLDGLWEESGCEPDRETANLARDLAASGGIAKQAVMAQQKKLGGQLLKKA